MTGRRCGLDGDNGLVAAGNQIKYSIGSLMALHVFSQVI